jgi:O-antigen ligase
MTSSVNTAVFRALLVVVVLAPLPLGGNRPWAWSLLAVLIGLLASGWALAAISGRCRAPLPGGRLAAAAIPFISALLWAGAQASSLVPTVSWHPLWGESMQALGGGGASGMISVAPDATWGAVMRLSCYAAVFLLAAQLAMERARAHEALAAVVAAGVAYAGYGLFVYFTGSEEILWFAKWAYLGDLTSTFVNRNAYGAYAGLGLVCCVAMFAHRLRRRREERRGAAEWTETLLVRAMPYLIGALLTGTALLLSHSRGAFLSGGLALAALMAALTLGRALPPQAALRISLVIFSVAAVVVALNGEGTLERLLETGSPTADEGRADVYRLTLAAITDAPLTGHGLGAFQSAFRMYRDVGLHRAEDWQYAHNVYLEMAMDLGIPATAAFYASLLAILAACVRGLFRRRRDQVYPATALTAAVLIGAHSLIDFSAQIPAVAVTLALLLGVGFAQSWSSRPSSEDQADA